MLQRTHILIVTALIAGCAGLVMDRGTVTGGGFDMAELDPGIRPADDLFGWVNARWIAANPIPDDWTSYGIFQEMFERTELQLRDIIEDAAGDADAAGERRQIGGLYRSFMNEALAEERGIAPIAGELAAIAALRTHEEVLVYMAQALRAGVEVPVNFYIDADAARPDVNLAYLWQDGLGMPDRDYYLADNEKLAATREAYRAHIERMFGLAGWGGGARAADIIYDIERGIAERHWTRVQNRDRQRIYSSKYTLAQARALSPGFDWAVFLEAAGLGPPETFVIAQTDYFAELGRYLRAHPVAHWREWLRFKTLKAYAPFLSADLVAEDFDFESRTLRGQLKNKARWRRGVSLVNYALGEALGKQYVGRHFPGEAKQEVEQMVEYLREAFGNSIRELDWMSPATRQAALEKLAGFRYKIGYPDEWEDYSSLAISADDLVGNVRRARQFLHDLEVGKLDKPVDRGEWGMTPQTINAYYRPTMNEIVFPAAILQPPFFDPDADPAYNYGGIGAVIGHEFSHGFDDQGRKFDAAGRLRDWWTDADAAEYERRAQVLVAQYGQYRPLPDTPINGELTLGENIGDLAGVIMAYRAWELSLKGSEPPVIAGLTGPQRFFVGYARTWRGHYRAERLREQLLAGPHAPGEYRVTGVVRNIAEFYEAFDVRPGDALYLPPAERARIW